MNCEEFKMKQQLKFFLSYVTTKIVELILNCYFYTIGNVKYNQDNHKNIKFNKIQSKLTIFFEKINKRKLGDAIIIFNSIVTIIIYYCITRIFGQKILSSYILNIIVYFLTLPLSYKIGKRQQKQSCIKKSNHNKHQCYIGYEIYHYASVSEQYIYHILTKLKSKKNN